MAAKIFDQNNQFIIRFPENIAEQLHEYFDKGLNDIEINLMRDEKQMKKSPRISLITEINHKKYKSTVMDLPTISSSFKTIDRYNFFKSNDISEMIYVHEDDFDVINESDAQTIIKKGENQEVIEKLKGESGISEPTQNIRQNFHRKKPSLNKQKLKEVDIAMTSIRCEFLNDDGVKKE